jgi:hypothetical protein
MNVQTFLDQEKFSGQDTQFSGKMALLGKAVGRRKRLPQAKP